jgi:enoyl-CoA hydratase/carnithine racemase
MLTAERAYEIGLVQRVYPAATFQESALALAQRIVARRLGDSLARVKALTLAHEPSLADLDLEIGHSVDHYFDPRTQAGLAEALDRDRAAAEGDLAAERDRARGGRGRGSESS